MIGATKRKELLKRLDKIGDGGSICLDSEEVVALFVALEAKIRRDADELGPMTCGYCGAQRSSQKLRDGTATVKWTMLYPMPMGYPL